jgi:hypothetical protein
VHGSAIFITLVSQGGAYAATHCATDDGPIAAANGLANGSTDRTAHCATENGRGIGMGQR